MKKWTPVTWGQSVRQISTFPVTSTATERKSGRGVRETHRDGFMKPKCGRLNMLGNISRDRNERERENRASEKRQEALSRRSASSAVRIMHIRPRKFQDEIRLLVIVAGQILRGKCWTNVTLNHSRTWSYHSYAKKSC